MNGEPVTHISFESMDNDRKKEIINWVEDNLGYLDIDGWFGTNDYTYTNIVGIWVAEPDAVALKLKFGL